MIATAFRQLVALSKPRIIAMLVLTALAGVAKASDGVPGLAVIAVVAAGGALAAAGSNAINQGLDADIDAVMRRTRGRPVPSQRVSRGTAIVVGTALVVLAAALFAALTNLVAAALAVAASLVYVFVYTMVMKRRSWNNIVIGGAAGAFPPLIGATAVTGSIDVVGMYMFALIFFWTPPHFWTLSMLLKDDYAAAGVPMLAAVAGHRETAAQVLLYVVLLIALAWLPLVAGYGGITFALAATALGAWWLWLAYRLWSQEPDMRRARAAYLYSLAYLAAVFVVLAAEPHLPWY
ncbi:MAG: protoheme IX farnesyltransferase [Chloroflexi bacterium]|nr:protoheme IX farnesyltransferase [Chloroflexota bacterium]